jgi:hypothetical protein
MTNDAPAPYYTAFIDEAGDPGLNTVRPINAVGGSEWLCLGAVIIRAKYDADVVEWVRSIQSKAGIRAETDLHYRNLPAFRKRIVCSELAKLPIRAFVLVSNKKNMRRYRNQRGMLAKISEDITWDIAGLIGIGVTAVILIMLVAGKKTDIPDTVIGGWATILGYYFGKTAGGKH